VIIRLYAEAQLLWNIGLCHLSTKRV
jgi:hypothetical protein